MKQTTRGQALISLLYFMLLAIVVTTTAVALMISNSINSSAMEQGTMAYYIAETGIENTLLLYLRNPSYTGGTISIDGGTAIVTVTGSSSIVITSTGTYGNFKRKIQVNATYSSGQLTIQSWYE